MRFVRRLHLVERAGEVQPRDGSASGNAAPDLIARLPTQPSMAGAFLAAVDAQEGALAFVTEDSAFTYGWLGQAAEAVSDWLYRQAGFERGVRVALVCDNSPTYVAGFFGILLAQGVVVPLPTDVERDRLAHVLETAEIDLALTAGRLPPRVTDMLGEPAQELTLMERRGQGCARLNGQIASPGRTVLGATRDDPALILLTAGSTGEPKLVALSHGNLLANTAAIIQYLGITPADRALALLPFHHSFGNSVLQTHLLAGATLVQAGSVFFPNSIVEALREQAITSFSGVPEMYRLLLTRSDLGREPLPSLRYMAAAGGALAPQPAQELARRIAPAQLFLMYGQTEAAARISYLDPAELARRPGSVGRGIPGVEVQVVDAQGRLVRPGEVGEVRARGANVMLGYYRDTAASARVLRDGWLYTGDLGTVDLEGYIYLRGRASELVKISGYRVHPAEIEALIARRLPVQDVAVVACETALLGARLAMFVRPSPGAEITADEVFDLCRAELPRHKIPVHVEVVAQIPVNRAMKIDRPALRRLAAERLAEENSSL